MRDIADAAGRVIAVGIPGPALDAATAEAIEAIGPGAIVLFRRNVETPEQLGALVDALHGLPSRPLVAIDHEGGRVTRLGPPFTAFPTAAEIGRAGVDSAHAVGEAIGRELASAGIDVDFAPVLDVGADDAAFIGDRAYSSDARRVAELGLAFAAGLTAAGVLPCGKHFPGHGATATDSHHERPVVMRSRAEILERELVPFRAAAAHVPMLMTGHVVYPALDPERIATLSPVIATTLLRHDVGFRGVLWSDDLSMRAVSDYLTLPDAAVAAIAAGVDGVLIVHDLELGRRAKQQLLAAVERGTLPAQRLREAVKRIASVPARRTAAPLELPCDAHAELAERVRVMAATQRA